MAYIYMVRCQDASLYTGIAQDVGRRMREHYYKKKTGAKYTKSRQVESLEMVWKTDNWAGAARLENYVKHLKKAQKEELIRHPETVEELFGKKLKGERYEPCPGLNLQMFLENE